MRISFTKTMSAPAVLFTVVVFAGGMLTAVAMRAQQTKTTTPAAQSSSASDSAKPATRTASKTQGTAAKPAGAALTTQKQKASYALGANIGKQLSDQNLSLDVLDTTVFLRGFRDALQGNPTMSEQDITAALNQLQTLIGETNLNEGQEFLAKNKAKEGIVALPSGLQYKVITMGTGPKPTTSDTVVCDYRGTFINGKEFDSSYKRGQTASFGVTQVIKGWTEALQLMPTGSKWELFIPADLAYGPSGRPGIPPNSTLIFDIELHSIKGK